MNMHKGTSHKGTIFLLDNQDSFTYNLVDELTESGFSLCVYRNDIPADDILHQMTTTADHEPVMLCLSPGPGHPAQAGCLLELIEKARGHFPMLGICLGFQALIHQAGGKVGHATSIMHGKTSLLSYSSAHEFFQGLPLAFQVARYHSLQALQVPPTMQIIATADSIPMACYDADNQIIGYQFHPESIMTTYGSQLLRQTADFLLAKAEALPCRH